MAITKINEAGLQDVSVHKLPMIIEGEELKVKKAMYDPVKLLAEGVNNAIDETQKITDSLGLGIKELQEKVATAQSTADAKVNAADGAITGNLVVDKKLTVKEDVELKKNVNVTGNVTVANVTVTNELTVKNINIHESIKKLEAMDATKCTAKKYGISVEGANFQTIDILEFGASYIAHYTGAIGGVVYIDKKINGTWTEQKKYVYPMLITIIKQGMYLVVIADIADTNNSTQKYRVNDKDSLNKDVYRLRVVGNSYGYMCVTRYE